MTTTHLHNNANHSENAATRAPRYLAAALVVMGSVWVRRCCVKNNHLISGILRRHAKAKQRIQTSSSNQEQRQFRKSLFQYSYAGWCCVFFMALVGYYVGSLLLRLPVPTDSNSNNQSNSTSNSWQGGLILAAGIILVNGVDEFYVATWEGKQHDVLNFKRQLRQSWVPPPTTKNTTTRRRKQAQAHNNHYHNDDNDNDADEDSDASSETYDMERHGDGRAYHQ